MDADRNDADDPRAGAVLLHPHPDYGGDRFNPVVDALFHGLPPAGVSTLRFDFSSSDVDVAAGEVRSALALLDVRPLLVVGYSFGADVATTIADDGVAGWYLIAPPLRLVPAGAMAAAADDRPKGISVPESDQYSPPERTEAMTAAWPNTTVRIVNGADHFLGSVGALGQVVDHALTWLHDQAFVQR